MSLLAAIRGITPRPVLALAPMAGITDLLFRQICEDFGADYTVTEMASTLPHLINTKQNQRRLLFSNQSKLNILQIVGNNAKEMAQAASYYAELGADVIDINMGCPATNVSNKGGGSALLQDLDLVADILKQVVNASPVPVTLKTRLGLHSEKITILDVGRIAEDLGVEMITVHGRTRACRYKGNAKYDLIAKLKQNLSIPVIANGDIDSLEKVDYVLDYTKCDGVMIGRAAIGKPWLFSDLQKKLTNNDDNCTSKLNRQFLNKFILQHIEQIHQVDGDIGVRTARKHIKSYLHNLDIYSASNKHINTLLTTNTESEQLDILREILINKTSKVKNT